MKSASCDPLVITIKCFKKPVLKQPTSASWYVVTSNYFLPLYSSLHFCSLSPSSKRFQLPLIECFTAMFLWWRMAIVQHTSLKMTRFSLVSAPSTMDNIQTLAANSIFRNSETAWQKCMISWQPLEDSPQSCDFSDITIHQLLQ